MQSVSRKAERARTPLYDNFQARYMRHPQDAVRIHGFGQRVCCVWQNKEQTPKVVMGSIDTMKY